VHIEANHASNQILANWLFPRSLRPAERDLHLDC
jgi:hypothetical protein